MGVFDDKKFEGLDWISQATEPIDSKLNEVLAALPECIEVDFTTYSEVLVNAYSLDISVDNMLTYLIKKHAPEVNVSYDQKVLLATMFEFEMPDGEFVINFEDKTITGGIKFNKLANTVDEDTLKGILGREGISKVGIMGMPPGSISRANEVMEILTKCEEGLRSRSERKKRHIIAQRLIALFKNNEWNIRDTELANKVGVWISQYVSDGNIAAFSNFCRLKVMTHKSQPIYSMEEVK